MPKVALGIKGFDRIVPDASFRQSNLCPPFIPNIMRVVIALFALLHLDTPLVHV